MNTVKKMESGIWKALACLLTAVLIVGLAPSAAFASVQAASIKAMSGDDTTPPQVTDVQMVSSEVERPGTAKVRVSFTETQTGTSYVSVCLSPVCEGDRVETTRWFSAGCNPVKYTDSVVVECPLSANSTEGQWRVAAIIIRDAMGNQATYDYCSGGKLAYSRLGSYRWETSSPTFTVTDEFSYAFINSLSNPSLLSNINSMSSGQSARIMIDGDGVLPAAAFDAIRGKNKKLVCFKDNYKWVFDGTDVVNESKDVDLNLSATLVGASEIGTQADGVKLTFASNGTLPGKAQVRFKSDYLYNNFKASDLGLYYDEGDEYVDEGSTVELKFDGESKWCYVDMYHNSTFVVSKGKAKKVQAGGTNVDNKTDGKNDGTAPKVDKKVKAANMALAAQTKVTKKFAASKKTKKLAKAKTIKLPQVATLYGKATWKVVTKDKKKVLTLKNGKVRVKKGAKRGTYTLKLKACVAETATYKAAATKVVTVKATVK